jgi:hypothetical protein
MVTHTHTQCVTHTPHTVLHLNAYVRHVDEGWGLLLDSMGGIGLTVSSVWVPMRVWALGAMLVAGIGVAANVFSPNPSSYATDGGAYSSYEARIVVQSLHGSMLSESAQKSSDMFEIKEERASSGYVELSLYDLGFCMVPGHLNHRVTLPINQCIINLAGLFGVTGPYVRYQLPNRLDTNGQFSGFAIGYIDDACKVPFSGVVKEVSFAGVCNDNSAVGNITNVKSMHPFGRSIKWVFSRRVEEIQCLMLLLCLLQGVYTEGLQRKSCLALCSRRRVHPRC